MQTLKYSKNEFANTKSIHNRRKKKNLNTLDDNENEKLFFDFSIDVTTNKVVNIFQFHCFRSIINFI